MARYQNPFYASGPYPTDPSWGAAGQSLATALFGDPAAAREKREAEAKLEALQAETEADRARGGYYGAQTRGENQKFEGREGLASVIANMLAASSASPPPSPGAGAGEDWGGRLAATLAEPSRRELGSTAIVPGNLDLSTRPVVQNPDGTVSTVNTISIGVDGGEALIPKISDDGRTLTDAEAVEQFRRTGHHLGIFKSPEEATRYALALHDQQDVATRAPVATPEDQFRSGLPGLLGALVRGDVSSPDDIVRVISAFAGDEELARRGFVGSGQNPSEWFALTPERRDEIARQGFDADYHKAVDVENIQSGDRRYSTDVGASTTRRGQDITAQTTRRGQDIGSGDRRYIHDTPSGSLLFKPSARIGNGIGKTVLGAALPGATVTDNLRTREEARRIYATQHPGKSPPANSWHYGPDGWDVRPMPGITYADALRRVTQAAQARGATVREAKNEGTHWHFAITGGRTTAPRIVPAKQMGDFDSEIVAQLGGKTTPRAMSALRSRAVSIYQEGGNPAEAVSQALREARYLIARRSPPAAPKPGGGRPAQPAARPAPQQPRVPFSRQPAAGRPATTAGGYPVPNFGKPGGAPRPRAAPARAAAPRVIRYDAQGRRVS